MQLESESEKIYFFKQYKRAKKSNKNHSSNINNFKKQTHNSFRKVFFDWFKKKKFRSVKKADACSETRYHALQNFPVKSSPISHSKENTIDTFAHKLFNETATKTSPTITRYTYVTNYNDKDGFQIQTESFASANSHYESPSTDHIIGIPSPFCKVTSKMFEMSSVNSGGANYMSSSVLFSKPTSVATSSSFELDDMKSFWLYPTVLDNKLTQVTHQSHLHNLKLMDQLDIFGDIIKNLLVNISTSKISKVRQNQIKQSYRAIINKISAIIDDKEDMKLNFEKGIQVNSENISENSEKSLKSGYYNVEKRSNRSLNQLLSDCSPFQSLININDTPKIAIKKLQGKYLRLKEFPRYNTRYRRLTYEKYQKFVLKSWKIFKKNLDSNKKIQPENFDSLKYELGNQLKKISREVRKVNMFSQSKSQMRLLVNEIMLNFINLSLYETFKNENKSINKSEIIKSKPATIQKTPLNFSKEHDALLDSESCSTDKNTNILNITSHRKFTKNELKQPIYLNDEEKLEYKLESDVLINLPLNITGDNNETDLRQFQRRSIYDINFYGLRKSPLKIEVTESEIPYKSIYKKLEEELNDDYDNRNKECKINTITNLNLQLKNELEINIHENKINCADSSIMNSCQSEAVSQLDLKTPPKEFLKIVFSQTMDNEWCTKSEVLDDKVPRSYTPKISRSNSLDFLVSKMNSMIISSPLFLTNLKETMNILKSPKKRKAKKVIKSFLENNSENSEPLIQLDSLKSIELWENYIDQLFNSEPESQSFSESSFNDHDENGSLGANRISSVVNIIPNDLKNSLTSQKVTKVFPYSSKSQGKKKQNRYLKNNLKHTIGKAS